LFSCEDDELSTSMTRDGDDLWKGDALEIFLWPDEQRHLYFQYDLSPLGAELPLLVPGDGQGGFGWSPWHYEGPRRVRSLTFVEGGKKEAMARVHRWGAEIRLPFALLQGVTRAPEPAARWRANFFRVDYEQGVPSHWAWSERASARTHSLHDYGELRFAERETDPCPDDGSGRCSSND
jgi:hypothetical protein